MNPTATLTAQQLVDASPDPAPAELRRRRNPVIQFVRLVVLGWRMFRLARH
jgi:hypothetical protein